MIFLNIIENIFVRSNLQIDSSFISKSIFEDNLLKPIHNDPIFFNYNIIIWPLVVFTILLVINVYIKYSRPKKHFEVLVSVFNLQAAKQMYREDYKLTKPISVLFSINFILIFSFLIFKTNQYYNFSLVSSFGFFFQYLFFVFFISSVLLLKILITKAISYCLNLDELAKEYLFGVVVFYQALSVILFPAIIFLHYSKIAPHFFLYPSFVICFCFYFLRLVRTFIISSSEQNIGFVQIFMYFCALEILPLLVVLKFLFINF